MPCPRFLDCSKGDMDGAVEHEHLSLNHDFDVFANLPVKLDDVGV